MLPYRLKALTSKHPFFKTSKEALALRQISELSALVNLYQVQMTNRGGAKLASIYLPPRLFSFLLKHYRFDEYSDFGYSLFGHSVFDLPPEYLLEYGDNHIVIGKSVFAGIYQHLQEDDLKLVVILPD